MNSIWQSEVTLPQFEPLRKNIKTDVLIIGGGLAGILCAYFLAQAGVDYRLVEADRICSGITKNTTAKITSQHGLLYHDLIRRFGAEKAQMYLTANEAALAKYRQLCANIDCNFETKDAFVYSISQRKKIEQELEALGQLNFAATFEDQLPLPFSVAGAVRFKNQAQFNPLQFIKAIAEGLDIYEHSPVQQVSGHIAKTDRATITAKSIVVATHFPFLNWHGSYFLKMYQHRSYVIGLENAPNVNGMYIDEAENGLSLRNYKDLLLVGGGSHRTGKKGGNWRELEQFATRNYPAANEGWRWATQDCMTLDAVPYIGHYSKRTPNVYVATGFNKWGMSGAMVAATILTDMITGKNNDTAPVFSPSRSMLRPQLAINAFEATTNLLTFSKKRCPHLGCALKWNPHERSWDCPCHGSRFAQHGKLIDNPATHDLPPQKE